MSTRPLVACGPLMLLAIFSALEQTLRVSSTDTERIAEYVDGIASQALFSTKLKDLRWRKLARICAVGECSVLVLVFFLCSRFLLWFSCH